MKREENMQIEKKKKLLPQKQIKIYDNNFHFCMTVIHIFTWVYATYVYENSIQTYCSIVWQDEASYDARCTYKCRASVYLSLYIHIELPTSNCMFFIYYTPMK